MRPRLLALAFLMAALWPAWPATAADLRETGTDAVRADILRLVEAAKRLRCRPGRRSRPTGR